MESVSYLESKKMSENFTYDEKKRFAFYKYRHLQDQKNTHSQKTYATISKNTPNFVTPPSLLFFWTS